MNSSTPHLSQPSSNILLSPASESTLLARHQLFFFLSQTLSSLHLSPRIPLSTTTTSQPPLAALPLLTNHTTIHTSTSTTNTAETPHAKDTTAVSSEKVETLQLSRPNDFVRNSKRSGSIGQMCAWLRGAKGAQCNGKSDAEGRGMQVDDYGT